MTIESKQRTANAMVTQKAAWPFVAAYERGGSGQTADYFDYATAVERIISLLSAYCGGCEWRLYMQEDGNEAWDTLEEDIRSGYAGLTHVAGVFDLVESHEFATRSPDNAAGAGQSQSDGKSGQEVSFDIRPSARNNVFLYPDYRVAFARVPRMMQYGIGTEDLIFAADDESLRALLHAMHERQLGDRRLTVFTDTRDGLQRERELITHGISRDDVMMDEAIKTQIYRSIDEFFAGDREFFRTYGIPYKRGILLYGKPGNGKTTLVKSIAGSVSAPVCYWQVTEFTNSESIQQVFAAATKMAPAVLVIEDIDSLPETCRSYFLNTLDGAASKEGIFLIGTTNYPERIDPALMNRAGRFDRAYEVKLPDEPLRLAYLQRLGFDRLVEGADLAVTARRTEGFSLAQLNELYVSAALQRHYEGALDLERLVAELRDDVTRVRKGNWMSDTDTRDRVGFVLG